MRNSRLLALALALALPLGAAISQGTAWDVRTGGSDSNGGGFARGSTGTDRSTQDAAFCTSADLATTGTAATSVLCPFSAASVGNVIQITAGGCTAGFYVVISVAVVTATLDRSAGTSTGCTFALGGGLLTIGAATAVVAGTDLNAIYIQSGTYVQTVVHDISASGVLIEGYATVHGDLGTAPLITTSTNSTKLFTVNNTFVQGTTFRNVNLSNTAATRGDCLYGGTAGGVEGLVLDTVTLDGCQKGINGFDGGGGFFFRGLVLVNSVIKNSISFSIDNRGSTYIYSSYFLSNGGTLTGPDDNGFGMLVIDRTVFSDTATNAVTIPSTSNCTTVVQNSVFYANNDSGIIGANNIRLIAINNIFESNGRWGIEAGSGDTQYKELILRNNAFFDNTLGTFTPPAYNWVSVDQVNYSASAFTDPALDDFSLNNTAMGGALLKATGFPGVSPMGTGFLDIGAIQSQGAGGGGGCTGACKIR